MKIAHVSDLHIGKRVNGFSLIEDQRYILNQILEILAQEAPDAVLIAGDIYDRPQPSAEAVTLADGFITGLSELKNAAGDKTAIMAISGNHDSGERLGFGSEIFSRQGFYIEGSFRGRLRKISLEDSTGAVDFYLLPFIKPVNVKEYYPESEIRDYNEAVRTVIEAEELDYAGRKILLAHQFVTGASQSDSEEYSVGGQDNVDAEVFDAFDYVALGHLHGPQKVKRESLRYSGSPLKYSFSEINQTKSITLVELWEKGSMDIRTVELKPLRDMREIRGAYEELMSRECWNSGNKEDYLRVLLTDEQEIPYAMNRLRTVYPNIMALEYVNRKTASAEAQALSVKERLKENPLELFREFYFARNNAEADQEKTDFVAGLIEEIWEGEQ